ncbi:hypothetical protein [Candidatus Thiosymbion oneisti]|uniref:hypothetical protein n=1 Tax=Candidatus Thiosymbion oneisti TaxID=589554 RepID=UPI001A9C3827|nr:hypothetical protein [Candidatus Thiosymbion oneisti]
MALVFFEPLPAVDPAAEADCAWVPGGVFAAGSGFEVSARAVVVFCDSLPVVGWVVGADFLAVIWSVPFHIHDVTDIWESVELGIHAIPRRKGSRQQVQAVSQSGGLRTHSALY